MFVVVTLFIVILASQPQRSTGAESRAIAKGYLIEPYQRIGSGNTTITCHDGGNQEHIVSDKLGYFEAHLVEGHTYTCRFSGPNVLQHQTFQLMPSPEPYNIHVHMKRTNCVPNGCGPNLRNRFPVDVSKLMYDAWFTEACNNHDCCYNECATDGRGRHTCDMEFDELLSMACRDTTGATKHVCFGYKVLLQTAISCMSPDFYCLIQCSQKCKTEYSGCNCEETAKRMNFFWNLAMMAIVSIAVVVQALVLLAVCCGRPGKVLYATCARWFMERSSTGESSEAWATKMV